MPDSVIVIYGCTEFDLRTFSHSVFDQPDAEPVAAQIQIVGAVADRMPVAADQRRTPGDDRMTTTLKQLRDDVEHHAAELDLWHGQRAFATKARVLPQSVAAS